MCHVWHKSNKMYFFSVKCLAKNSLHRPEEVNHRSLIFFHQDTDQKCYISTHKVSWRLSIHSPTPIRYKHNLWPYILCTNIHRFCKHTLGCSKFNSWISTFKFSPPFLIWWTIQAFPFSFLSFIEVDLCFLPLSLLPLIIYYFI